MIAVSLENIPQDTLSNISAAVIGDSDSLKVGEQVVAIGNALGYGQSVTTGIVSATNRTLPHPLTMAQTAPQAHTSRQTPPSTRATAAVRF